MAFLQKYLRQLRERHGLSQEGLAQELKLSRPTYLLIEKGERELTVSEAQKLSEIYGMSLEEFTSGKARSTEVRLPDGTVHKEKKPSFRISVPQKKLGKFREVLLYILEKVGAKPNIGETVLYKLLYFIDFDFYEKFEEQLIGATYIKNHYGPTPVEFRTVMQDMVKKGELAPVQGKYFQYPQKKYLPLRKPNLSSFSGDEIHHIDEVLQRLSDKSAKDLSDYSHGDMPWKVQKPGEALDYELVFYRDEPYSVRSYDDDPL